MANHSKRVPTLRSLSKRQWMKITAVVAATGMLAGAGIVSRNFYAASQHAAQSQVTSYSATDADALQVSRGEARESMRGADKNTTYVTVKINGESRTVLGSDFTDVKSVLDAGNITLEPDDSVSPQLTDPVSESTVITIQRAGTQVETNEEPIAFNTVKKETDSLPQGQEKVENEGEEGVMETTSLVINHESGWRVNATNASSGAYGLAQALPGSKMASVGADWATNYQTQLKWFWNYCASRYGSIQGAYSFWTTHHWY